AAPAFAVIAAEAMRVLGVPGLPEEDRVTPSILTADLSRGAAPASGMLPSGLVPAALRASVEPENLDLLAAGERLVPDLAGRPAREAVHELALRGFTVRLAGHGFVVGQEPAPGTALLRGSVVRLTLSFEPPVSDAALRALPLALPTEAFEP
ncbi:MAG TPA: PASTA domain-containing protein, partial [Thermoanaerobaculia bacterium]|nr:PASTA domain-containing protein [Thermoanaerobaculia bacterium]